jgi:hypothetical protein
MHVRIRVQNLCIASWIVTEEEELIKINLGSKENLQHVVNTKKLILYSGLKFRLKCNKTNNNKVCSFMSTYN